MSTPDPQKFPAESALQICLLRLTQVVEDENVVLRKNTAVSHAEFTVRKNHALRDIMAITRVGGIGSEYAVDKPLLGRLSLALGENAELLKLHIGAVSEISDVIIDNLKRVDSDGTYSRCL